MLTSFPGKWHDEGIQFNVIRSRRGGRGSNFHEQMAEINTSPLVRD